VLAVGAQGDLVGELGDVGEQAAELLGLGAVVQGGDEFDGALQAFEVGLELGLDGGVEHGVLPFRKWVDPVAKRSVAERLTLESSPGGAGGVLR
jgi:hypothetical protein